MNRRVKLLIVVIFAVILLALPYSVVWGGGNILDGIVFGGFITLAIVPAMVVVLPRRTGQLGATRQDVQAALRVILIPAILATMGIVVFAIFRSTTIPAALILCACALIIPTIAAQMISSYSPGKGK